MKTALGIVVCLFAVSAAFSAELSSNDAKTLSETIEVAYQSNPDIQAAQKRWEAAKKLATAIKRDLIADGRFSSS